MLGYKAVNKSDPRKKQRRNMEGRQRIPRKYVIAQEANARLKLNDFWPV